MNVLERIKSGQVDITVDVWHSGEYAKNPISKTEARAEIMRLLKIGAEAEKAINACFKEMQRYEKGDGCVWQFDDNCEFVEVCKMVREGNHGL